MTRKLASRATGISAKKRLRGIAITSTIVSSRLQGISPSPIAAVRRLQEPSSHSVVTSPRPLHHTRWHIGAIVFRLPLVLDPFCVSGAHREPFASSATTERAYAAPTDDHVMPPWLASGSSKRGGGEPAHNGARAKREGQQKADTSGKGVQAEVIQFLGRLVRVNAREIAELAGALHLTYLLAENAKIGLETGQNNNRRAQELKEPSTTTLWSRRAWMRPSCRSGAR